LQTYLSALAFAPSNSVVRNTFRSEMEEFLQVLRSVATDWGFELQTLKGHTDQILSIAPSIDGRRLVTVGWDKTVRLWDVESGTEEKHFAHSVSVSPNGRYAAWGLDTGEIYIWDADEDAGQVLKGHKSRVRCLHFSSDSETLLSGSTDIWKWSPQAGNKRICQLGTAIRQIAMSPNGKFVVFGSEDDTISVFHCTTHQVEQILKGRPGHDTALALSADNKTLLCGLPDGQIWAIDLERGLLRERFPGHRRKISAIAISPDRQNFASASYDKTVRIWGPKSQTPLVLSSKHFAYEACFSADGRMLYTHDSKDGISEWD
ncbi:WD40 repeat-like protein, partial [Piedraia hortae CBS 480.64]